MKRNLLIRLASPALLSLVLTASFQLIDSTDAHAWHATLKKTSQRKIASRAAKKAAAKKDAPKGISIPEGETAPIDELEEQLYTVYKNKKTKALKTAYDALEAKKYAAAKKAAQSAVADSRFGDYARWISAQASIQEARAAVVKNEFESAAKDAQSAITLLAPLTTKFPYSPLLKSLPHQLATAEGLLGRAQCGSEKWTTCQATLEGAFVRVFGTPDMAYVQPEELSSYAKACSQKKSEFCLSWVQRLAGYYSKSTEEFKAIAKVFPEYKEKLPRAPSFARQSQSYRAPDLDQAAIDQAMQLYLDGKNRDAIEAFRKFTDEYPRSSARFRALYWLAQALKKQGKEDESRRLLGELQKSSPLTYYGLLAAIETGVNPHSTLDTKIPMGTDFDPFLHPLEIYRLRRAQNLIASKAYGLAAIELKDMRGRDGLSNGFLVYLAMLHNEAKSWVTAFPILNELISRGYTGAYSEFFSTVIFPLDPLKEVKKFSEAQKIDPVLVMSLIKQESSFDQTASSSSGALGLMQLMPTTAVDTVSGIARSELLAPEANLKTGTLYLSKLLNRFQGNIVYATASYNAGPGAVNRWIRSTPQGRPMLEFIEAIPYKETREYVMAIIRNYFWYTHKLNPEQSQHLKLDFFWHNYGPQVTSMSIGAADNSAQADEPNPAPSPSASASPAPSDSSETIGSLLGSPAPSASPSALPATSLQGGPALGVPPGNPSTP